MSETINDIVREMRSDYYKMGRSNARLDTELMSCLQGFSDRIEEVAKSTVYTDNSETLANALDENAVIKAALKPIMQIDMRDETKFTQTQVTMAVAEAQRIVLEAWGDRNYFWKGDAK